MFESQYNEEMAAEVPRPEARQRAILAGHPEWENTCRKCGCELQSIASVLCLPCAERSA